MILSLQWESTRRRRRDRGGELFRHRSRAFGAPGEWAHLRLTSRPLVSTPLLDTRFTLLAGRFSGRFRLTRLHLE